ncbi:MAG: N-6 DNA methylase [Acidobacteria bacterium]|nr:N-6 DNA methylase [Acidobacteriota bacterium]
MNPLETYIRELREIRSSGAAVKETSYYGALENLFSYIGKTLKPKVRRILQLQNKGAGIPDGGFFTWDQFQKGSDAEPLPGQMPAHGVIEIKSTSADVWQIAQSEQVSKYLATYHQVLVTNYRDFVLLGRDGAGKRLELETYRLAASESDFWAATAQPQKIIEAHGECFIEYLKRVMLHAAPLAAPEDVAWFLASYARDAKARIEDVDLPALTAIREALEQALGIKFDGQKGDHFFRSTLVQTLFYGIFSAWVLWHKENPLCKDAFDWKTAAYYLRVPIIQALFEQVSAPTKLKSLGLVEVLDWTGMALNRVNRAAFFDTFQEGHAVQYFYEPFLEAFDPVLRKELGVWYTPTEVVQYMVARVDTVLREELNIEDGLADPRVYVLDPCCGTGAYLVEVLKRIHATLKDQGSDALLGDDLKRAAIERVFGFEILPAPFVVAHLQLGLLLQNLDASLSEKKNERVSVYLTNALTGWEPPQEPKTKLLFPELEAERDAAEHVKREVKILVILGNPPYNGFAGVAVDEERDLSNAYRTAKRAPAPQGQGLNDLSVRFYRMGERRIVEKTGQGVVCFISNYSWLDGLSFTGMRERYLEAFDRIWIDCLNGDKYKTGKLTPEGAPDPSIFSTPFNPEGIQVGTAIALLVKKQAHANADAVRFRHLWGKTKRAQLLETAIQDGKSLYQEVTPPLQLGFSLMPGQVQSDFLSWPLLPELFPVSFPGVRTSRDDVVVDIDRERLVQRMKQYFDSTISHEEMRHIAPGVMQSTARFNAVAVRDCLIKRGFLPQNIVRYCYRPFDARWLYWEPETKLLDEKRSEYFPHVFDGNLWIEAHQKQPMERFDRGYVVRVLADNFGNGLSSFFPLYLAASKKQAGLLQHDKSPLLNLSAQAIGYIDNLGATEHGFFYHVVTMLHAPTYRTENAGALRQDWPRVPLPNAKELLLASAELGRQVAALLDSEHAVSGVTSGTIRAELKVIGGVSSVDGKGLNPAAGDLALTVGWGHAGKGGVTMPGKGKVIERDYTPEERQAIAEGAAALGLTAERAFEHLGETTCDVYLNTLAYWENIPAKVWDYTIGGYQVIKKWLSYREQSLLGRALTSEEAREVRDIARRIAAILLLKPALDANYAAVKLATYVWHIQETPKE